MRWQRYLNEKWNNMSENLSDYSLDELYEMSKQAKDYYFDLRDSEPSHDMKNECIYRLLDLQCLQVIKDINEISRAISVKQDAMCCDDVPLEAEEMTYEKMMKEIELNRAMREAYRRGEIEDDMTPECRQNWIEKCNS